MALNRKIAYIDLTSEKIEMRDITPDIRNRYIGGRSLGVWLLYNSIKPNVNAFSPENVIVISTGLFAGTPASASCPVHICAKSPLSGYYGSYSGGNLFSSELRWAGFDHLVISGKAKNPSYLWIHDGNIELRDAQSLTGKTTDATHQAILENLNDSRIKTLTIGPAGENLVRFASLVSGPGDSDDNSGIGAVMGSKNLKSIAVRGTMSLTLSNPREALTYNNELTEAGKAHVKSHYNPFASRAPKIPDPSPGYQATLKLLRETMIAPRYGLDAVETANRVLLAVSLYESGTLPPEAVDGKELNWNNREVILTLIKNIINREGPADIFAEGYAKAAAETAGYVDRPPVEIEPDTTISPAFALGIAVSAVSQNFYQWYRESGLFDLPEETLRHIFSQPVPSDFTAPRQAAWFENTLIAMQSLGVCKYRTEMNGIPYPDYAEWSKNISLVTGLSISPEDIWQTTERAASLERLFNVREGLAVRNDQEILSGILDGDKEKNEQLLVYYYQVHGWDENGVPREETLANLGIEKKL